MYKCKYFKAYELVDPEVYNRRGEMSYALLDDRVLKLADLLRGEFGSVTINDWYWGGTNQWRGLRTPESPYYRVFSQHSSGRALDLIFAEKSAQGVREWLEDNEDEWKDISASITVENEVTWLHIDVRNDREGYNSFNP